MEEYFEFLDDLRETGATNMYGAGPYLRSEFIHINVKEPIAQTLFITT